MHFYLSVIVFPPLHYWFHRIYALEPSGHNIYGEFLPSLSANDAKTVFCVHTDPGDYGINKTLCDVDVFVNFKAFTQPDEDKQKQPGCPIGNFQKYTANGKFFLPLEITFDHRNSSFQGLFKSSKIQSCRLR